MRENLRRNAFTAFILLVVLMLSIVDSPVTASSTGILGRNMTFVIDTVPGNDTASDSDTVSYHLTGSYNVTAIIESVLSDSMSVEPSTEYPELALQQHLKGNLKGLYVQTPSMEPGTKEHMFLRGLARPLFSKKNIYEVQPAIYLNGIPLISDNPFVYDIQKYQFNPIGPATNGLAAIDLDDIKSIKILKSPEALALLGSRAANGAIMITTKNAQAGEKKISLNSYIGVVPVYEADPINADYIAGVRQPLYDKYATSQNRADYPEYLSNTSDPNYYGPADWTDLYYKKAMIHGVNGSLTGGTERANFRFFGGQSQSSSGVDGTKLDRYTTSFYINMLPLKWLTVSTMIHATRLERQRNRSLRDRFSEMNYLPDLTYPLAPNKTLYGRYLQQYDQESFDKNKNDIIEGSFSLQADLHKFTINSQIAIDYNEGSRDLFWPSTLLEDNNYVSNYYGENRRFIIENTIRYTDTIGTDHVLSVGAGQSLQSDLHSYNYNYAYKGPSDYIKVNVVNGNSSSSNYLEPQGFIAYRYIDRLKSHLTSFYGHVNYAYKDLLSLSAIVRSDGSSFAQPTSRWFVSPAFSASWNLKNQFFRDNLTVNNLSLKAAWGKTGKLFSNAEMGAGPSYMPNIGWNGALRIPAYNGVATLTRPYSYGWVGYGIKWPYTETKSVSISTGLFNNRLNADITLYNKDDKRMVLGVPTLALSGYSQRFEQGMWVRNQGIEAGISGDIIRNGVPHVFWTIGANVSINKNTLKALPNGQQEVIIGNQKLEVGKSIDQFWLLRNEGIYLSNADVPINSSTNTRMNYKGIALKEGDAKWKDVNGDFTIDDKDKTLIGHRMPNVIGGVNNKFKWRAFSLSVDFYFALGQDILNQQLANRLDFINTSAANDMQSVVLNEVTFWQKTFNPSDYPKYNPWSDTKPYQADQNLYLEDGSYLKLRTVSLGYDLAKTKFFKKVAPTFTKMLLYVTANNIWTLTNYTGSDPEMVNYLGYDTGYGMPIMKSFTVGLKVDL